MKEKEKERKKKKKKKKTHRGCTWMFVTGDESWRRQCRNEASAAPCWTSRDRGRRRVRDTHADTDWLDGTEGGVSDVVRHAWDGVVVIADVEQRDGWCGDVEGSVHMAPVRPSLCRP
eukprot:TRINITY_DN15855_c0_g1_i1.p3 TRINITY_DN15855_c0_g1~~TRINITY_DN15855_c0_g1_i1.p3  ORF type:complete len:117 (-),score=31.72 TRINITY_DN15855_c0_g1_i1:415-765(-)